MANLTDITDEIAALLETDLGEALTHADAIAFTGTFVRGTARLDEAMVGGEYLQRATIRVTETEYAAKSLEIAKHDKITRAKDSTDWSVALVHPAGHGMIAIEVAAMARQTLGRM